MKEKIIEIIKWVNEFTPISELEELAGRSGISVNDYCNNLIADRIEPLIATEVERRISERLPSEEDKKKMAIRHIKSLHIAKSLEYEAKYWFKHDFMAGINAVCSRLTENKQEGQNND